MKKILCSFIAIFFSIAIYSQTPVPGGSISGTWTLAGSPYLIQDSTIILNGATLTIEAGVLVEWQGSYAMWVEGQILAQGTETDSVIFTAADTLTGWKGIRFDNTPAGNDTSRFHYCLFEHGKAHGALPDNSGGALAAYYFGKIIIDHCMFYNNRALDNTIDSNPCGGAIALDGSSPIIKNSLFKNNSSLSGAGIFCFSQSNPTIINNIFTNNTAPDAGYWGTGYGGAITCYLDAHPTIKNNTFCNNYAGNGGGAIGCVDKCNPIIDHNLIFNNTSDWIGGGIEIQDTCNPIIINNTIADNQAEFGGGIDIWGYCEPEITNTILWGNTVTDGGNQVNIKDEYSIPNFYYCDIQGGQAAFGGFPHTGEYRDCIDSIPLFEDTLTGNYHLTENSPCIDAGDPTMFDPDGTRCDIGAFYYHQINPGFSEFKPDVQLNRVYCYPNPTQGMSDIRYQISDIRNVILAVYDIHGQEICVLVNKTQAAGEYTLRFDASGLPAGLYIVRLQAGNESAVGKLFVVH